MRTNNINLSSHCEFVNIQTNSSLEHIFNTFTHLHTFAHIAKALLCDTVA